jgi:hypothetical protein
LTAPDGFSVPVELPLLVEPLGAAVVLSAGAELGALWVVAEALVLAPVDAIDEPDHQSLLARCFGVAAR